MGQKQVSLTIAFADISGSTRLYDTLGDAAARVIVSQCLQLMSDVIHKYSGSIIKTIGDEIMCTFPAVEQAVDCCVEMQEAVHEDLSAINPGVPSGMSIRVGLHHGQAIEDGGDVFGDAVNVAARMAALAKGGQIITTESSVEMLDPARQSQTRHLDRLPVKGKTGNMNIHEVIWQAEDMTRMATGVLKTETSRAELHLQHRREELVMTVTQGKPLIMGRSKNADLVVADTLASREHARIEARRGKFVLTDQSTNGTYVRTPEGPLYLRRDELVLSGQGSFSLGRALEEEPEDVVWFRCE